MADELKVPLQPAEAIKPLFLKSKAEFLANNCEKLLAIEKEHTELLVSVLLGIAPAIYEDFNRCMALRPFWENYAPEQRGRQPTGESFPWGDLGEHTIAPHLIRAMSQAIKDIRFPGLPFGGDFRYSTDKVIAHLDLKITGPNDNPNEVVVNQNQVSGDGSGWNERGILNSAVTVKGPRRTMNFQPVLTPIYVEPDGVKACLTFFLKAIYRVDELGVQPLEYMELVCTPNGLLAFDGPRYIDVPGLFIPGKDIIEKVKRRTRIRLDPLCGIASWRCTKIYLDEHAKWVATSRATK